MERQITRSSKVLLGIGMTCGAALIAAGVIMGAWFYAALGSLLVIVGLIVFLKKE